MSCVWCESQGLVCGHSPESIEAINIIETIGRSYDNNTTGGEHLESEQSSS